MYTHIYTSDYEVLSKHQAMKKSGDWRYTVALRLVTPWYCNRFAQSIAKQRLDKHLTTEQL
jgi:hypothetical protein